MTHYIPLLAAVSAALIAGYFSFVSLVNSKEQKTSEFRQNWIDSLRNEISEFVSSVYYLEFYYQQDSDRTHSEFVKGIKEVRLKYASAGTAILLRVNENERNKYLKVVNDDFLQCLLEVMDVVNKGDYTEGTKRCNRLIDKSKPLLKEEWRRVKAGEITYKVIKYFSIALFVFAFITAWFLPQGIFKGPAEKSRVEATKSASDVDSNTNSVNCTVNVSTESPISKKVQPGVKSEILKERQPKVVTSPTSNPTTIDCR